MMTKMSGCGGARGAASRFRSVPDRNGSCGPASSAPRRQRRTSVFPRETFSAALPTHSISIPIGGGLRPECARGWIRNRKDARVARIGGGGGGRKACRLLPAPQPGAAGRPLAAWLPAKSSHLSNPLGSRLRKRLKQFSPSPPPNPSIPGPEYLYGDL